MTIERIRDDIQSQFHHAPVRVPKHQKPFSTSEEEDTFTECLLQCLNDGIVPHGFGVYPDEWDSDGYPSVEILKSGRRGTKELRIALPIDEWLPKAELWVTALTAMNVIIDVE